MKEIKEYKPEKCPDCGAELRYYHGNGGTRVVCMKKCQGYKVIASRNFKDNVFVEGDVL